MTHVLRLIGVVLLMPQAQAQEAYQDLFERHIGYSVIKGVLDTPSQADGVDTFYFGPVYEYSHDQCEAFCNAEPRCMAYSQFPSWYPDPAFFTACVGRSNRYEVWEVDSDVLSGLRIVTTPASTTAISTTSPLPSVNSTLPKHMVRVNGTALTADGEALTPQCAVAHVNNLNQKTKDMVVRVNAAIGDNICMTAADILVISSAATMFIEDDKSQLAIDHVLRVLGHHLVNDVETCALENGAFLNDLSNWLQPIFPPVPDCSSLEIRPNYFNTSGTSWKCENQINADSTFDANNLLSYENVVSEVLNTVDGGNLDGACALQYSDEASKKTSKMMTSISNALTSSACSHVVTVATYSYSFTALQNQAFFQASFYYAPSPAASFSEFVACIVEVHDFSMQHGNWSPGSQPGDPFLPIPPGCPALEHDTTTLDDDGHRWLCV